MYTLSGRVSGIRSVCSLLPQQKRLLLERGSATRNLNGKPTRRGREEPKPLRSRCRSDAAEDGGVDPREDGGAAARLHPGDRNPAPEGWPRREFLPPFPPLRPLLGRAKPSWSRSIPPFLRSARIGIRETTLSFDLIGLSFRHYLVKSWSIFFLREFLDQSTTRGSVLLRKGSAVVFRLKQLCFQSFVSIIRVLVISAKNIAIRVFKVGYANVAVLYAVMVGLLKIDPYTSYWPWSWLHLVNFASFSWRGGITLWVSRD